MDLAFTPEELAFREEVRGWIRAHLDPALAAKVLGGLRLSKDDIQGWARTLGRQGWLAYRWPRAFGGPGWSVV
ncbi:MAG: acyl-CoA dehydrogenase family protein, partial [Tepidimonas ignava]|nr:acyl-CoA dehydrogenase family protein [Tepidimonas ignava]